MLIKRLNIENFGVYQGKHEFDFSHGLSKTQNMVAVRGKNGVGKTTILEAIQLGVMGALSLDFRVTQSYLESYLGSRIHLPQNGQEPAPNQATIELDLQYLFAGNPSTYRIRRMWEKHESSIHQSLLLFEDDQEIREITDKEKELFLRQLISPGLANLIFFDGEHLQRLNLDHELNKFLAESCKVVLGLHLVDMLEKDISLYIKQLNTNKKSALAIRDTEEVENNIEDTRLKIHKLASKQLILEQQKTELESRVQEQEAAIAGQGRWEEEAVQAKRVLEKSLEMDIARLEHSLRESANGLVFLAAAPKTLNRLKKRLLDEGEQEKYLKAGEILKEQFEKLSSNLQSEDIWNKIGAKIDGDVRKVLVEELRTKLGWEKFKNGQTEKPVHILAEQERPLLLSKIERATTEIPKHFASKIEELNRLRKKYSKVRRELKKVPENIVLAPFVDELKALSKRLGETDKEIRDTEQEISKLNFQITLAERELQKIQLGIRENKSLDKRLVLATQTQQLLKEYHQRLLDSKLEKLGKILVKKFNLLCQKDQYFDSAKIDSQNFNLALFREGHEIDQDYFSAGERQLLALSALWALREMTNIQLPLVIDTPLGRLDKQHRERMIDTFLPQVSHQVIILGTEAELDNDLMQKLSPKLHKVYELTFDAEGGCSNVEESTQWTLQTV